MLPRLDYPRIVSTFMTKGMRTNVKLTDDAYGA